MACGVVTQILQARKCFLPWLICVFVSFVFLPFAGALKPFATITLASVALA